MSFLLAAYNNIRNVPLEEPLYENGEISQIPDVEEVHEHVIIPIPLAMSVEQQNNNANISAMEEVD